MSSNENYLKYTSSYKKASKTYYDKNRLDVIKRILMNYYKKKGIDESLIIEYINAKILVDMDELSNINSIEHSNKYYELKSKIKSEVKNHKMNQ